MKRTALKRRAGLRRSAKPMNPINRKRKAELHARNFGDEAEAVRMLPCLVDETLMRIDDFGRRFALACLQESSGDTSPSCHGNVVAAHVAARGMGGAKGGRFDLVPLCDAHHREAGEARTSEREAFESRYGIDLRAEADRLAAAQALPLGICGLAQRWLPVAPETVQCGECSRPARYRDEFGEAFCDDHGRPLAGYDLDALLGWVRRECEREAERRRDALADANKVAARLGLDAAWSSCAGRIGLVQREQKSRGRVAWDGRGWDDPEALAAHIAAALGLDADRAAQLLDAAEAGHG